MTPDRIIGQAHASLAKRAADEAAARARADAVMAAYNLIDGSDRPYAAALGVFSAVMTFLTSKRGRHDARNVILSQMERHR